MSEFVGTESSVWDSRLDKQSELLRLEATYPPDSPRVQQALATIAMYHAYLQANDPDYNYNHYLYFERLKHEIDTPPYTA